MMRPPGPLPRRASSGAVLAALLLLVFLGASPGCSVRKYAVNRMADALSGGGETYARDEDPELVGAALPFSLKLMETVLAETPDHEGLLLSACEGFTSYAYGWVDAEADRILVTDLRRGKAMKARAGRLFLRGHGYCARALERDHPGLLEDLDAGTGAAGAQDAGRADETLAALREDSVPLLYWTAASLGLAISAARGDARMIARRPVVGALLERALALDETWNEGALHEMTILYAASDPLSGPGARARLRRHFERALELSGGDRAGLYVAWAETLSVQEQDLEEFREMLRKALAVDARGREEDRMANLLSQRRARWLIEREEDLFLAGGSPEGSR